MGTEASPGAGRFLRPSALAVTALRSTPISLLTNRLVRPALRTLSYHEVADPRAFDRQVAWLADHHQVVGSPAVIDAAQHGDGLPDAAVWITFDDGHPSVVDQGLDILRRYQAPATLFVCPGLIDTDQPFWWKAVASSDLGTLAKALDRPLRSHDEAVEALKRVSDPRRRTIVGSLPVPEGSRRQLTSEDLRRWLDAGHTLGSHSWDHPCLDQATVDEQRRQVQSADHWLRTFTPDWAPIFAYPNGNFSAEVESLLIDLDYRLAVLHDHAFSDPGADPLLVSRLHVDTADPLDRFRSIVCGTQPILKTAVGRLRARRR